METKDLRPHKSTVRFQDDTWAALQKICKVDTRKMANLIEAIVVTYLARQGFYRDNQKKGT